MASLVDEPIYADVNLSGMSSAYGIESVPMLGVSVRSLPGGSVMDAGAPVWWITPGGSRRPSEMSGLAGMGLVPDLPRGMGAVAHSNQAPVLGAAAGAIGGLLYAGLPGAVVGGLLALVVGKGLEHLVPGGA